MPVTSSMLVLADFAEQLSLLSLAQFLRQSTSNPEMTHRGPAVRTFVTTSVSGVSWLQLVKLCGAGHPDFPIMCLADSQTARKDVIFIGNPNPNRKGKTLRVVGNYGNSSPYGYGEPIDVESIEDNRGSSWDILEEGTAHFITFGCSTHLTSIDAHREAWRGAPWEVRLHQPIKPSGEVVCDDIAKTFLGALKAL